MQARARFLGHSIHQMLIVFPLGLLATSVVFDIASFVTGNAYFSDIAYWMISAGLIGGILAAIFGLIDFTGITKETRARHIAVLHGLGNVVVMVLFALSWVMRNAGFEGPFPFVFSALGTGLAVVTGWLGGELIDRHGVGVDDGAHLNSPSSLSKRPASAQAE